MQYDIDFEQCSVRVLNQIGVGWTLIAQADTAEELEELVQDAVLLDESVRDEILDQISDYLFMLRYSDG
tara:strand:- start:9742 stop:9948 length:207 start_codon:yes stop_codon:yes gene_type:complete